MPSRPAPPLTGEPTPVRPATVRPDDAERGGAGPLALAAYAVAALVLACAAGFPFVAEAVRPGPVAGTLATGLRSAGWAAGPAAALVLAARWAGRRPLAGWAAFVGSLLVLALGVALYASALDAPRPYAPAVALRFVPLRQLAAAAFVVWAVWLARRTR